MNTSSKNQGSEGGFIPGASLIFRAGLSHRRLPRKNECTILKECLIEKLFPNIRPNCVTLADNSPYHSIQENKPPSKHVIKQTMIKWLEENKIQFSVDIMKDQLFQLIQRFKPAEKNFILTD